MAGLNQSIYDAIETLRASVCIDTYARENPASTEQDIRIATHRVWNAIGELLAIAPADMRALTDPEGWLEAHAS